MEMRRLSCALVDFFIFELVSVFGNRVTAGMSWFLSSLYTIQVQVQIQTNFSLRNSEDKAWWSEKLRTCRTIVGPPTDSFYV